MMKFPVLLFVLYALLSVNGWSVDARTCTAIPYPLQPCDRDSPQKFKPCLDFCSEKYGSLAIAECVKKTAKDNYFCLCVDCKN